MVALERTTDEDALDGLGHVQPGAAERRVERHDAVVEQPADDRPTQVAGQVVPDQQESERRQRLGRLVAEPGRPTCQGWPLVLGKRQGGQTREHLGQFGLEPGVQHRVRRLGDPLSTDLAGRGTEQGQQLGRPAADVLVWAERWLPLRRPAGPWLRNRLVWTGLILAPDGQTGRLG
jgi:hypothetical protein